MITHPDDIREGDLRYVHDYDTTRGRSLWLVWRGSVFRDYAVRWPSGNFTTLPRNLDPDVWLDFNTKEPTP